MRSIWNPVPLLLILVALAFAGGAADASARDPGTGAAVQAGTNLRWVVETRAEPERPDAHAAVRVSRSTAGTRTAGQRSGTPGAPLVPGSLVPLPGCGFRAVPGAAPGRSARDSDRGDAARRAGAASAHATSLPPPALT